MANIDEHLQALDTIVEQISQATRESDWAGLQVLDTSARPHIDALMQAANAGHIPSGEVIARLDRLQQCLDGARTEAEKARDEATAALKSTGRTHQAAQAYLKTVRD